MPDHGQVAILRGDARALPLPDASVDLIVTSPPYWALRSYTDAGQHYDGQIGAEPTPAAYVDALIDCTQEWMRVLKPTGSLWINLGDKYATERPAGRPGATSQLPGTTARSHNGYRRLDFGLPAKSLIGLPWRYALRAIDDLGLILRAEVVWSKPNGLPESVTDRVRRSHEQWFHLVKQPRYYAAVDEIREPQMTDVSGWKTGRQDRGVRTSSVAGMSSAVGNHPLGKLPGSVWTIATQPLTVPPELGVDHYAAFPIEWPRRIIAGWSPPGICTACGEGRRPLADRRRVATQATNRERPDDWNMAATWAAGRNGRSRVEAVITGYACACPEPGAATWPALVLDPFGGTGTTALAARALGRHAISVDMSADYCRLAAWRTSDPGELARAMGVAKPPPVPEQQLDLWATGA